MILEISRLHFPVTTLGPGRRIGIWFQGCSIRCAGCVSADTWGSGKGRTSIDEVMARIEPWLDDADGITISGGEPFDQEPALHTLLASIRERTAADVLVFSGYPMEVLQEKVAQMPDLIDALISDPYVAAAGQSLALRGSDNQRLHALTPLGEARFLAYDRGRTDADSGLDLMFDEDGVVFMAGIPRAGDMERLRVLLASSGHVAQTSQSRS